MRTIRLSLYVAALFAAGPISDAIAQQSHSTRSVNQRERIARASWQPNRPRTASETGESAVKQVDHGVPVRGVPSLPAGSVSLIDPPVHASELGGHIHGGHIHDGHIHGGNVLDGQVYAPSYDGACDALPSGTCGCDDTACDGGCGSCDAGGCDSMGCDGACGGTDCSCCGELCSPEAWRPCVTICLPQDGWASFEYLGWWQDGMRLPPLVTSNVVNTVPQAEAGVLTSPSVRTLYGGDEVLTDPFSGGRLRFGLWLDRCHTWGVGAEFFQLGGESETFSRTSTGDPILARPFFNTQTGLEDSELVAFPGVVSGTVAVQVESQLQGAGVHFRHLRCCDEGCSKWLFCGCKDHFCSRTEALLGWRYLQLDESVAIREDLTGSPNNPGTFDIDDRFETRNQFNGIDLGWSYRQTRGYWTFDTMLRLGVGNTRQTVKINGTTVITSAQNNPPTQTFNQGILAGSSNSGTYTDNQFAVVPEFNANIGYQLTDHIRLMAGYTFLYWSNVVRPGDQIDLDLNPELFPPPVNPITGAQRPTFDPNNFDTTDYWAQGLNAGIEYRW